MTRKRFVRSTMIIAGFVMVSGCATPGGRGVLEGTDSQLKLRSIQSRAFDTRDKQRVLRSVIATLQDLEFMIEAADAELGTVTARKFVLGRGGAMPSDLKITVTVRPRGDSQMLVRANAEYQNHRVEEPEPYQNFFSALGKSLFLTARETD